MSCIPPSPPPQPSGAPPPGAAGGLGGSRGCLGRGAERCHPPPTLQELLPSLSSDARTGAASDSGGGCGARGARGRVLSCGGRGGGHGPAGGFRSAPAPRRDPRGFKQPCCPQINALQSAVPHRGSRPAALMLRDPPGTEQIPDSPPGHGDPSPNPLPGGGLVLGTAKPRGKKSTPTKRTLLKCCSASCPRVHL